VDHACNLPADRDVAGSARYFEGAGNAFAASLGETYAIVGSCINCTTPANLLATLALMLVGVGLASHFERRKEGLG
jgi:hypothetical protein